MSLKDLIARDIENVFMNASEFCDNITIQSGTSKLNVIGSLQSNAIQNNAGNNNPLQENAWTLYIKYPLDIASESRILSAGNRITIDNKSFSIVSVSDEMGLATIQLKTAAGR